MSVARQCLAYLAMLLAAAGLDVPAAANGDAKPPADRVRVPAGPFTMGADQGGEPDERPSRRVTLKAFSIDRLEVTNADYGRCVRADACRAAKRFDRVNEEPRKPAVGVSWDDAQRYCAWVGARLPTEAEWEKAARGPDARRYPWGNHPEPDAARAVFASMRRGPAEGGRVAAGAGPYGTLDQAGNVWEWVSDVYGPTYYQSGPIEDPVGPTCSTLSENHRAVRRFSGVLGRGERRRALPAGARWGAGRCERRPLEVPEGGQRAASLLCEEAERDYARLRALGMQGSTGTNPIPTSCERVLRGGAWNYGGPGLRSSNRVHHPPTFRIRFAGFRCAVS